ncbi:MAG: hypothetical protein ACXV5C_11475 [Halobacteriota archaeon]
MRSKVAHSGAGRAMESVAVVIPTLNEERAIGDVIERIPVSDLLKHGFEIEADMYSECARKGLSIAEIPILYRPRADQPKLSSLRDGLRIGAFLCRKRLMARTTNPAANSSPDRAGTPDGRHMELAQQGQAVINRRQKRIYSSEFRRTVVNPQVAD